MRLLPIGAAIFCSSILSGFAAEPLGEVSDSVVIGAHENVAMFEFEISNKSKNLIKFNEPAVSCSCVKIVEIPKSLKPGEAGKLKASVEFQGDRGSLTQRIILTDSLGLIRSFKLQAFRAYVVAPSPSYIRCSYKSLPTKKVTLAFAKDVKFSKMILRVNGDIVNVIKLSGESILDLEMKILSDYKLEKKNEIALEFHDPNKKVFTLSIPLYIVSED